MVGEGCGHASRWYFRRAWHQQPVSLATQSNMILRAANCVLT